MRHYLIATTLAAAVITGCTSDNPDRGNAPSAGPQWAGADIWAGGHVWNGDEHGYIENAALLVREGRVEAIVALDEHPIPDDIEYRDVSGRYVIPGLINAHGHVGMARGLETGPAIHSEENVREQLERYAHYGITGVVSLGDEPDHAFRVRNAQEGHNPKKSRLWLAGDVLNPDTEADAADAVAAQMAMDPDWFKIRVDDQLGRREAMPPPIYNAVINAAHQHDRPLASHMVTLEDSKGLLEAGTDLLAHSVRDAPVDDELINAMLDRDICITPTLTREVSVYVYAERPAFFDDPFFLATADQDVLDELQKEGVQERFRGPDADYYREALPLAKDNMMRLHDAGVRIAMGTDSGPPARFQGYFEHMEMAMMQSAGMSPEQILHSATRHAADCMNLVDVGRLQPGYWADFLVLKKDPKEDIGNLRALAGIYLAGQRFDSVFTK